MKISHHLGVVHLARRHARGVHEPALCIWGGSRACFIDIQGFYFTSNYDAWVVPLGVAPHNIVRLRYCRIGSNIGDTIYDYGHTRGYAYDLTWDAGNTDTCVDMGGSHSYWRFGGDMVVSGTVNGGYGWVLAGYGLNYFYINLNNSVTGGTNWTGFEYDISRLSVLDLPGPSSETQTPSPRASSTASTATTHKGDHRCQSPIGPPLLR
jgi:hypothetical protein